MRVCALLAPRCAGLLVYSCHDRGRELPGNTRALRLQRYRVRQRYLPWTGRVLGCAGQPPSLWQYSRTAISALQVSASSGKSVSIGYLRHRVRVFSRWRQSLTMYRLQFSTENRTGGSCCKDCLAGQHRPKPLTPFLGGPVAAARADTVKLLGANSFSMHSLYSTGTQHGKTLNPLLGAVVVVASADTEHSISVCTGT